MYYLSTSERTAIARLPRFDDNPDKRSTLQPLPQRDQTGVNAICLSHTMFWLIKPTYNLSLAYLFRGVDEYVDGFL
jgi:hypothetical protein